MRTISAAWNNLTEEQRLAWVTADRTNRHGSRAFPRRRHSGRRLFTKVSFRRLALAQDLLSWPPATQNPSPTPIMRFDILNDSGRVALELRLLSGRPQAVMVSGWRPLNPGVMVWRSFVRLGLLPAPVDGTSDITRLYVANPSSSVRGGGPGF